MNYELDLLYHIEDSIVEHIEVVGVDAFRDEGFAVVVFDLLSAMYLHKDEVGIRLSAHLAPSLIVIVIFSNHQILCLEHIFVV